MIKKLFFIFLSVLFLGAFVLGVNNANATHSWGGYHWARTSNPFTVKLGNNVSSAWNNYLSTASSDWSLSSVLDTAVVAGKSDSRKCRPTAGRVEVCDNNYGNNGWLGIAQIWVSGSHITQGTTRMNDTYFNTLTYNTPAWRSLVICQEVGHTFGLAHQDENFSNPNLGTCMDYTNDPDGKLYNQLSNEHPNQHDYDELGIIYAHLDPFTTLLNKAVRGSSARVEAEDSQNKNNDGDVDTSNPSEWGKETHKDSKGRSSDFERDLGNGNKLFTFVIWAE